MAKKNFWLGILVLAMAFGMTVVGCDNDPSNNNEDIWSNVTSFSQIDGIWKAPSSYTGNIQGITATCNTSNYRITFDATTKTMSVSGATTTTYSGGNINALWADLKEDLEYMNQLDGVTVSFDDANHSYTMTCNNFSQTLTDADLSEMGLGFQINQDGTKLIVFQDGIEIIYTK